MDLSVENIKTLDEDLQKYSDYYNQIGQPIVDRVSEELDSIMNGIKSYLLTHKEDIIYDLNVLQKMFLELTSSWYTASSEVAKIGLYDDLSKLAYKDAYNNSYIDLSGSTEKRTVAQLQATAEKETLNENVLNFIYSRTFKILQSKLDGAEEMIKALSKVISSQMQQTNVSLVGE